MTMNELWYQLTIILILGSIRKFWMQIYGQLLWNTSWKKRFIFQDDNAPAYSSKCTRQWAVTNKIPQITWPPQSPYLNIIENVWCTSKLKLQTENDLIKRWAEFAGFGLWRSLSVGYIQVYIHLFHVDYVQW